MRLVRALSRPATTSTDAPLWFIIGSVILLGGLFVVLVVARSKRD